MTTSVGYVIYDTQEYAIYGAGATVDEAWEQVMDECERPLDTNGALVDDDAWYSMFTVSCASQALLDLVEAEGGAIAWCLVDGVVCAPSEGRSA